LGRKSKDDQLFSNRIDDLLPPDSPNKHKLDESKDEPTVERPEVSWWLFGIGGGIVFVLITSLRLIGAAIRGNLNDTKIDEVLLVAIGSFGVGFVFGVAMWGFQWFKWRNSQSKN